MNTKIIKLDINKKMFETITAKQRDTKSRFILFNLYDGPIQFDLTGRTVRVYGEKKDNTTIFNDLVINDAKKGYCTLELTNQMLAVEGMSELELVIFEGEKRLSTMPFILNVVGSKYSEDAIASTNEFKALSNALKTVGEIDNKADKKEVEELSSQLDNIAKPLVSFIFDDNDKNNAKLFDIFKEYGFVFSTANIVIKSLSNSTAAVPLTKLIQEQGNGFDVLSHSMEHSVLASWGNMSKANAKYEIEESANKLREFGFPCNGFIASNNDVDDSFMPIIRANYDYAFITQPPGGYKVETYKPLNRQMDLYKLYRWNIDEHNGNVETVKKIIDKTIKEKGYTSLFAHKLVNSVTGSYMFTEAHIRGILSYVKEKVDKGELMCLSVNDCICSYFGKNIENRTTNKMTKNIFEKTSNLQIIKQVGNLPTKNIINDDEITVTFSEYTSTQRSLLQYFITDLDIENKVLYSSIICKSTSEASISLKFRIFDSNNNILDTIETTELIGNKDKKIVNKISIDKNFNNNKIAKVLFYLDITAPSEGCTITIKQGMLGFGVEPIKPFIKFTSDEQKPIELITKGSTVTTSKDKASYYGKIATININTDYSSVNFAFAIQENANASNRFSCGNIFGFVRKNGLNHNFKLSTDGDKILNTSMNFYIVVIQNDESKLVAEIYCQCKLTYQYCLYNMTLSYTDVENNTIEIMNKTPLISALPSGNSTALFTA